ncbi:MAG: hypothetical protein ACI8P0_003997 [Planctomycetaceae bacterium]
MICLNFSNVPAELTPSTHLDNLIGVVIACSHGRRRDFAPHQSSFHRRDLLAQQFRKPMTRFTARRDKS